MEEKKISKFSSGLNILMRLDNLWKNCQSFKREGKYYQWNEELDTVWLELARDLNESDYYDTDKDGKIIYDSQNNENKVYKKGYKTKFDEYNKKIKELLPFTDNGEEGFEKPSKKDIERRGKQYNLLMEKHLFLARLENELGKGTSWEDEDEDF